jgi:hypothetical protein
VTNTTSRLTVALEQLERSSACGCREERLDFGAGISTAPSPPTSPFRLRRPPRRLQLPTTCFGSRLVVDDVRANRPVMSARRWRRRHRHGDLAPPSARAASRPAAGRRAHRGAHGPLDPVPAGASPISNPEPSSHTLSASRSPARRASCESRLPQPRRLRA